MTATDFDTLTRLVTTADIDGLTKAFKTLKDARVLQNVLKYTDCTALKGTLLHISCSVGNESLGLCLVECGAPINTPDKIRNTALHVAAVSGMIRLVRSMCEAGGDVFAKNYRGFTPLQEATLQFRFDVSLYLAEVMLPQNLIIWPSSFPLQGNEDIPNSESTECSFVFDPEARSKVAYGANIWTNIPGEFILQSILISSTATKTSSQSVTCISNTMKAPSSHVNSATSIALDTAVQKLVDSWLVEDPQPIPTEII